MTVPLEEILDRLPRAKREAIAARTKELLAEEMSLRDLRRAHELTQERVAESLGIGQEGVSRLEKRADLLLSTLRGYIESMGGRLRLVADFPDRPSVVLTGLAGMEGADPQQHPDKPL
jgi:DNA-binding XRE family transcriptional regulator